jgi:hypothetical protein
MPRFDFVSPGAAAVDELQRELTRREVRRRQDFMDKITLNRENRNDEVQRAQLASIDEQRNTLQRSREQSDAVALTQMLRPGQSIDDSTDASLTKGNLGILVQRKQDPLHEALGAGQQDTMSPDGQFGIEQAAPVIADKRFTGTPAQLKSQDDLKRKQEYLAKLDPKSEEYRALAYEMNTGNNAPAFLGDDTTSKGAAAQEYEYYKKEELTAGRTPLSFDEYQARDANRKKATVPVADAGTGMTPRQEFRFNSLASERGRSPLMRAADRTIVLKNAANAIQQNPSDPSNQLALAYSWIQALDTYQSAVREGELQLMGGLATRWENMVMELKKILPPSAGGQGAVMPPETAKQIAANAQELIKTIEQGRMLKEREFAARADEGGVSEQWTRFMGKLYGEPDQQKPLGPEPPPQTTNPSETPEQRAQRLMQQYSRPPGK